MQAAYRFRQTSTKNSRAACPCVFSKRNAQQLTPAHALLCLCACIPRVRVRTKRVRVFSKAGRTPVYHFVTVMGETTQATDAAITIATTIPMASIASDCYTTGNNEPSITRGTLRIWKRYVAVLRVLFSSERPGVRFAALRHRMSRAPQYRACSIPWRVNSDPEFRRFDEIGRTVRTRDQSWRWDNTRNTGPRQRSRGVIY